MQGSAGYEIDLDGLRRAAAGARVLLLCHPHNPSGRVFRRAELEAIAEVVLGSGLFVVSDEIHADLVLGGEPFVPFASLSPEVAARTLTLCSASKAFHIAGLRCAVAVFGSDEIRRRFLAVPRHVRGGINILGLEATRAAWLHGQPWLDAATDYLRGNRDLVARRVADSLPGVRHHPPEATYLAWLDCRALRLAPSPFRFFLERAKVALSDGASFGTPGEGFVRLNFATSRRLVVRGARADGEGARRALSRRALRIGSPVRRSRGGVEPRPLPADKSAPWPDGDGRRAPARPGEARSPLSLEELLDILRGAGLADARAGEGDRRARDHAAQPRAQGARRLGALAGGRALRRDARRDRRGRRAPERARTRAASSTRTRSPRRSPRRRACRT